MVNNHNEFFWIKDIGDIQLNCIYQYNIDSEICFRLNLN